MVDSQKARESSPQSFPCCFAGVMISNRYPYFSKGEKQMNTKRKTSKDSSRKITASNLIRWAGVSAMVAGLCFIAIGMFHPLNILSSVTTAQWGIVHILATAMGFFGLFGLTGIYARQIEKSGWLGLVGYVLMSLWLVNLSHFTFIEAFVLPPLVAQAPTVVESVLGIFTKSAGEIHLGALSTIYDLNGFIGYMIGGVLLGIATFRARILPRWAGVLLAIGALLVPFAAVLPPVHEAKVTIPGGLALVWLGYSLWAERRQRAVEPAPARADSTAARAEASKAI
jgi:hypothetical protein